MVCVPCIVIPLLLWIFHKFIQPFVIKFWNPWKQKEISAVSDPPEVKKYTYGILDNKMQRLRSIAKSKFDRVVMLVKNTVWFRV